MRHDTTIELSYSAACDRYASLGVDAPHALEILSRVPVSLNCWQGDDVRGFEHPADGLSTGGIQVTGTFPGRARTPDELRGDLRMALSLIPGKHRVNLHAMYGEFGGRRVDRDAVLPDHFAGWAAWARTQGVALDFNATCFAHPMAEQGTTLSHPDPAVRNFWIDHTVRARAIAAWFGQQQGSFSVHDLWIPDGSKDLTVSRLAHRERLQDSLDRIYATSFDPAHMKDAVEGKLFGIGSEAFVVGSYEFYFAYALRRSLLPCIDMGHFHPTESVADKISALLPFFPELLVHVSRGVRWDSDHVVIVNDDLSSLMGEIVRAGATGRVHLALDFFDASINRVGAWVIGTRATQKALLAALLEPIERLRALEREGDLFARLALLEEAKTLPLGAVWDFHCLRSEVPPAERWLDDIHRYEKEILRSR